MHSANIALLTFPALREQRIIELALEHWHNITCLNFERRDDEPEGNRIVFTDVDGCASNVGRHPLGEAQYVSLAPECIRVGRLNMVKPFGEFDLLIYIWM